MGIGLAVGVVAGFVLRSRWAMLAAPTVAAAVYELARLGTDGPTVDGIHTSPYGIFALVVGRVFHTLIGLTPMVLGAAMGAGTARRLSAPERASAGLYIRRGVAGLTAVALIALAALIARPPTTAPLLAADARPVVGSINELTTVEAGGKNLGLMLRGMSTEKPVLLFLAGGPGGSERGAMRNHLPNWKSPLSSPLWTNGAPAPPTRNLTAPSLSPWPVPSRTPLPSPTTCVTASTRTGSI